MSKTIAVRALQLKIFEHFFAFSAKQREMTLKFCVIYGTWTTTANFSYFHLELNAVAACLKHVLVYRADLDKDEFRLQNINSFFTQ